MIGCTFKKGDVVELDDQFQVEITSWPVENVGFFGWQRHDKKSGGLVTGNGWYGEDMKGNPVHSAARLVLIREGGPVGSTLPPLPAVEPAAEAPGAGAVTLTAEEYAELLAAAAAAKAADVPPLAAIDGDPENPPYVPTSAELDAAKPKAPAKKAPAKAAGD